VGNYRKTQLKEDEKGPNCYGCGKSGHLKNECLELRKTRGKSNSSEKSKGKRALIMWEDEETSFTRSDSENEVVTLCFMGEKEKPPVVSDSPEVSDSNSDFNPSYDELKNILIEMHGDAMNAFKNIGPQILVPKKELFSN